MADFGGQLAIIRSSSAMTAKLLTTAYEVLKVGEFYDPQKLLPFAA